MSFVYMRPIFHALIQLVYIPTAIKAYSFVLFKVTSSIYTTIKLHLHDQMCVYV